MSGQVLNSPFPVYSSQSYIHQNETDILKSLSEYNIVSLADFNAENTFGTDIPEIPKSALDKYVPWNSDDEVINNEISSTSNSPFAQQVCLSVSEPDPIPVRHLSPDDQLTHPHAVLFNRQDLLPVTFVNPINLNQTTNDTQTIPRKEIADSFLFYYQRKRMQDPEKIKIINQRKRKRYREMMKDPEKRKLENQRKREMRQDPERRKLINQRQRELYKERIKDPEKRKMLNQYKREQMQDPEKRKLENQRQRERYREIMKDPEKRMLENQRQRERYREKMKDPEKRKLVSQRRRERRQDLEKRKSVSGLES
ncbi:phage tail tape measure protein [Endozoicomonas acroporae]|uniref:phage tail tape measure protein n=2 Tax=Endozoicomonas acroporae TaxID=1701104 RepID=UPI000C77E25F